MALPKKIKVKENLKDLQKLYKKSDSLIQPRIKMLIELKKYEDTGISKRALAKEVGVDHNSIQTWRTTYLKGGLELLCRHNMKGYKPTILNTREHQKIAEKLSDPENGLQGYKELLLWVEDQLGIKMKYSTLYSYCRSKFGTKIKVARKSHVYKDNKKVELFKKTLHISAKRK